MNDPRLNSVHLKAARRQQFRAARSSLLNSSGPQTLAGDSTPLPAAIEGKGPIPRSAGCLPADIQFVLADADYLYPLHTGINTVGRMPDNNVVVPDPYVSRRHVAVIVHANGVCELHDVASKNGTFLNGRPLSGPTRLHSGDIVQLSDYQLAFLSREDVFASSWCDRTQAE